MKQNNFAFPNANAPINILLADDDNDDRYFFERVLNEIKINTRFAAVEDGEELMNYLFKNSDKLPDIIFLDFNMPRKTGLECLEEISLNEKLKHIPVIIYSTSSQKAIFDLLYEMGAYYYVRKTDLAELKNYLDHILTLIVEKKFVRPARANFILSLANYNLQSLK